MLSPLKLWTALIALIKATDPTLASVEALPYQDAVGDERNLFDRLETLALPAAVVMYRGDKQEGENSKQRMAEWSIVLVREDLDGLQWQEATTKANELRDGIVASDYQEEGETFRILGKCELAPVPGWKNKIAYELVITTEQAEAA